MNLEINLKLKNAVCLTNVIEMVNKMSNQIIERIDTANKFRESVKTEQISSPNNDEYTKWHEEFAKEINSKGGYIPPDKEISEEIFYKEDR